MSSSRLSPPAWTWRRMLRLLALVIAGLAIADYALEPTERSLEEGLLAGRGRNAPGPAIADATRWMLLETPAADQREALALVGSSVSFGPNLAPEETIAARLAGQLAEEDHAAPVFHLSQPGGSPRTPIPIAAALGTHPVKVLLVELLVPSYAERDRAPAPGFGADEVALLQAASPVQRSLLAGAKITLPLASRLEARLTTLVRANWRLYRLRGVLWWDSESTPSYLVWSLRRQLAVAGWLPKRFHGQTTNVGKLPWREAYTGGQRPLPNQRFRVPTGCISAEDYAFLTLTQELARAAGIPILFYEIPLNLAFQREFGLMDEAEIARLGGLREALLHRMATDGLVVVEAPEIPEEGFLDKAHLTPLGCDIMARHLKEALQAAGYIPEPRRHAGRA